MQIRKKMIQLDEGCASCIGADQMLQQHRYQGLELTPRGLPVERPVRAAEPASDNARRLKGRPKPQRRELIECSVVVGIRRKTKLRAVGFLRLFKQPRIVVLHVLKMTNERGRE